MKASPFKSAQPNPDYPEVIDIDAEEVFETLGKYRLIDVRGLAEYVGELGHIQGAQLVELQTLPDHESEIKPLNAPTDPVIFICKSGGRSARACDFALRAGKENVYNMRGGMLRWTQLAFAVTTEQPKGPTRS